MDIDDLFHITQGQLLLRIGTGRVEIHLFACGHGGAFHNSDLADAAGKAFGDQRCIILDGFREGHILQPETGKNMAGTGNQNGIQTDGFQTSRIQNGQIQTGGHFLLQNGIAQAHTLPGSGETGRGDGIDDILFLDSTVNGCGLGQYSVDVLGLVGIQGRIIRPFFQKLGCPGGNLYDLRVIGGDKCCQQLGVVLKSLPFVISQSGNLHRFQSQSPVVFAKAEVEVSVDTLSKGAQVFRVHL